MRLADCSQCCSASRSRNGVSRRCLGGGAILAPNPAWGVEAKSMPCGVLRPLEGVTCVGVGGHPKSDAHTFSASDGRMTTFSLMCQKRGGATLDLISPIRLTDERYSFPVLPSCPRREAMIAMMEKFWHGGASAQITIRIPDQGPHCQ